MQLRKIIISGGGTGGHIYPALALADEFKRQLNDVEILFVGANGRMEMEKVPEAGYKIIGLNISGLQRKITSLKNLSFPFKLIGSLMKAKKIVKDFQPNVAIGVGGYASGPLLQMASKKGVFTAIQEQNSYPGITNKLLAKKVDRIYTGLEMATSNFPKEKILHTGNPLRSNVDISSIDQTESKSKFGLTSSKKTILIIGGSLGAVSINRAIPEIFDKLDSLEAEVIWQTGKRHYENIHSEYENTKNVTILPFIKNMGEAYAAADLIISRAGAMSISELSLVGKPTILVPSPNVSEDHQTFNARSLSDKGAAILLPDNQLPEKLSPTIVEVIRDSAKMTQLSAKLKGLARPNAASDIVKDIIHQFENRK